MGATKAPEGAGRAGARETEGSSAPAVLSATSPNGGRRRLVWMVCEGRPQLAGARDPSCSRSALCMCLKQVIAATAVAGFSSEWTNWGTCSPSFPIAEPLIYREIRGSVDPDLCSCKPSLPPPHLPAAPHFLSACLSGVWNPNRTGGLRLSRPPLLRTFSFCA